MVFNATQLICIFFFNKFKNHRQILGHARKSFVTIPIDCRMTQWIYHYVLPINVVQKKLCDSTSPES